jgi:iron complex transport system substrate-binding protein
VESMRAEIARARADPKGKGRRTIAVVQINPPWAAGRETMVDELIELAGGRNVEAGVRGYKQISNEKLLALDPEVVLILSPEDEGVLKTSFWRSTRAVKRGHYYKLDPDIFVRPTPRIVEGLKALQKIYAGIAEAQ